MDKTKIKYCVMEDNKICDNCGQCLYCDYNPLKLCDNCCKCINFSDDAIIKIDGIENPQKH